MHRQLGQILSTKTEKTKNPAATSEVPGEKAGHLPRVIPAHGTTQHTLIIAWFLSARSMNDVAGSLAYLIIPHKTESNMLVRAVISSQSSAVKDPLLSSCRVDP